MTKVSHFEIVAEDTKKAIEFYEKAFGWKFAKWEGPIQYWMIDTGKGKEGINGGLAVKESGDTNLTINIIDVKDIDKVIKKIEANGGKITAPKSMIPGIGWIAYFQDPEGTHWGIMQEAEE